MDIREAHGNVHIDLEMTRPMPRHRTLAELAVKYGGSGRYLDVGCGLGFVSGMIAKMQPNASISIADAYSACLDKTAAKLPRVEARYLLDEKAFAPDKVIHEKFDVIIFSHELEHLLDPIAGLRAILSLLNEGGVAIVAVPNTARPEIVIRNLFKKHYVNRGHVFSWDASHWRNFLERICGFDVAEYKADVVALVPGKAGMAIARSPVGTRLAKAFPWWSESNIAVIRKPLDAAKPQMTLAH